jgi:hypothetical protein
VVVASSGHQDQLRGHGGGAGGKGVKYWPPPFVPWDWPGGSNAQLCPCWAAGSSVRWPVLALTPTGTGAGSPPPPPPYRRLAAEG